METCNLINFENIILLGIHKWEIDFSIFIEIRVPKIAELFEEKKDMIKYKPSCFIKNFFSIAFVWKPNFFFSGLKIMILN